MINPRDPDYDNTPVSPKRCKHVYAPRHPSTRPEVSVITPCYNVGEIFHETATSLLNQSLQNWEWIIVNDCSSDPETLEAIDRYRNDDPRIRIIDFKENQGTSAAKNAAYAAARSDLVFQLDSDDLIEPTTLEKMLWFLRTNPEYAMVHSFTLGFGNEEYIWERGFHGGPAILNENPIVPLVMIRKAAFEDVGGYDESNREGLEDWEFWISLADKGHWGATIPEHLSWYRRKPGHSQRWLNWDGKERQNAFHQRLRDTYTRAFGGSFPQITPKPHQPYETIAADVPITNPLSKENPRVLMLLPWLRMGGADKWNLDAIKQFRRHGWDVSIVTTQRGDQSWLSEFASQTPDIFVMDRFVRDSDVPLFLRHMIDSRQPDVVMISNSSLSYQLLPYLRAMCPNTTFVDYNHIEEDYWNNGGHPRQGAGMQDQLDLNIVISKHLQQWMVNRGAEQSRIEVCYCNVDSKFWTRNTEVREQVRKELGIGPDEQVILFAGRLCDQKQPRIMAKTLLRVAQSDKEFTAIIAGDGPHGPWLRSFVREHHLEDRVKLLGEVSSERVRDLMSAADIYFLASLWEGIALSIYEAMSMELAVVGAIVGGQLELVTPDCGILLPKADADTEIAAYAKALGELLSDPTRIKQLGQAARIRVKTGFTLDGMGDRMVEIFGKAQQLTNSDPRQRLSEAFARETATQAVEFFRVVRICEDLWVQHEQRQSKRSKSKASVPQPHTIVDSSVHSAQAALMELTDIEASKAWRALQSLKRSPLYSPVGRYRYGSNWSSINPNEPPESRLTRIKGSNAYKIISTVKHSRAYRLYKGKARLHNAK